jgi:hypothetical protein
VAVIVLALGLLLYPVYQSFVETRNLQVCQSNMLKIAGAMQRYSEDYDGTLPTGGQWMDTLGGFLQARSGQGFTAADIYRCPLDHSGAASSYVFNEPVGGLLRDGRSSKKELQERQRKIGRQDRAPIVLEKHGSGRNASVTAYTWGEAGRQMTLPHNNKTRGSYITGALEPKTITREQLDNRSADRF